jgi:hypothetical protein
VDDQLRVSLDNVRSSDWDLFEDFANAFLLSDFPTLRPIGGTNDKGRDGVLFAPDPQQPAAVVLQYSVSADWLGKVRQTVKRLREKDIACSVLVYATNRSIGPSSDELEGELRGKGIALSVRDRDWWVMRAARDSTTRHASEALKDRVIGRLVTGPSPSSSNGDLSKGEVETALFFLELHVRDANKKRSLTKLTIEWLVLSALTGTDPDHRRTAVAISDEVAQVFPTHDRQRVNGLVRGTLRSLRNARRLTVSVGDDSYALHFTERQRIADLAAKHATDQQLLLEDLQGHIGEAAGVLEYPEEKLDKALLADTLMRMLAQVAAEYGNSFATAVATDSVDVPRINLYDTAERLLINDSRTLSMLGIKQVDSFNLLTEAASRTLLNPATNAGAYLHDLAEAYTLRAFMRETADVQDVVDKLFSRGTLVLDTSVILPIFSEVELPETQQGFSNLLRTATHAGMTLVCTPGVINEIVTHLENSLLASRIRDRWNGPLPMVYDRWRVAHAEGSFQSFVENFIGAEPETDIESLLEHMFGIELRDLTPEVAFTDSKVVARVTELWRSRKRVAPNADLDLLLRHDVEMYMGVLGLRQGEKASVYGHEAWWVSLDTSSSRLQRMAADESIRLPSEPVMHPNFLSRLLALGPSRRKLTTEERGSLPLLLAAQSSPWAVPELSEAAAEIRKTYAGRPEYFLRRKLRERANEVKTGRDQMVEGEISFY